MSLDFNDGLLPRAFRPVPFIIAAATVVALALLGAFLS